MMAHAGTSTAAAAQSTVPTPVSQPPTASTASDAVATAGTVVDRPRPSRTRIEMIPRPKSEPQGVCLEFKGSRWYLDGSAVAFSPDRFEPIGEYRGFPVYRDKRGRADEIWVSVVKDGPVAPYARR